MIEEILKQIKEKKDEIHILENQLKQDGLKEYNYLVGKFFKLAATTSIYITSLGYIGDGYIYVNCINITGGKYDGNRLRINHTDDYELRFSDLSRITEITKGQFIDFLDESLEYAKKMIVENL